MTSLSDADSTLGPRPAGYSVVLECLSLQEQAIPRSKLKRILGFQPLHPDAINWFTGAIGEIQVGRLLNQLGPEWTVLHAVPVGIRGSDIDHVLIGPVGVFTVNTKHHAGARVWVSPRSILVSGQKVDHLRNSRHEAARASKLLTLATGESVTAHPLLVIFGAARVTIRQSPVDVTVLTSAQLVRWLRGRRRILDGASVEQLAAAASKPSTWSKVPDVVVDAAQMVTFADLRKQVDQARVRRLGWTALAMLAFIAAVVQVAPVLVSGMFGLVSSMFAG